MKRLIAHSAKYVTRDWPDVSSGHDEVCNRWVTLTVWPLGYVSVAVNPKLRDWDDGPCEECRADHRADGACEWCGGYPCWCIEIYPADSLLRRVP